MFIENTKKNKLIKRINDLNQDAKILYDEYYLFTDSGIIISDEDNDKQDNGYRLSMSLIEFPEFENICIKLKSGDVFTNIRDNKKEISGIFIEDSKIYLGGEVNRYHVGEVCENLDEHDNFKEIDMTRFVKDYQELSPEDVLTIVENGMVTLEYKGIKANTTKDLIPGLKKDDRVKYNFVIDKDNPELASFYICHIRAKETMWTMHTYPILII